MLEVLMQIVAIVFISLCQQAKQQRLAEDYAAVNETLETASGFVSDTERTLEDVDAIVQVRLSWSCSITDFFMSLEVSGGIRNLGPFVFLWLTKWGGMCHNLIDWYGAAVSESLYWIYSYYGFLSLKLANLIWKQFVDSWRLNKLRSQPHLPF